MLSSPSPLPSTTLLIEQLRNLEAQVPVRATLVISTILLTWKQPPGLTASSASSTEHVATANQILSDARSLREQLAAESTEASRKLSNAVLDVVLYTEKLENVGRLLALADSCIGQIRSRMRANSIPIRPPTASPNVTTPSDSVEKPTVSGKLVFPMLTARTYFLHNRSYARGFRVMYYILECKTVPTSCYHRWYIICPIFSAEPRFPTSVSALMIRPSTSGNPPPTPPEGLVEYLTLLSQHNSLLSTSQPPSSSATLTPTPESVPPPVPTPTEGRSFSRANRGTGGALAQKQKVSKEITASATKRKSFVDPHVQAQVPPMPEAADDLNARQAKRRKVNKACTFF